MCVQLVVFSWLPPTVGQFWLVVAVAGDVVDPQGTMVYVGPDFASAARSTIIRARQRRRGRGVMAELMASTDSRSFTDLIASVQQSEAGAARWRQDEEVRWGL